MNKQTLSELYKTPLSPWEIASGDYIDLACSSCAQVFANENKFEQVTSAYFQDPQNENGYASECYGGGHELDYPASCACGEYLDCNLTPDGVEYLKERELEFPKWLVNFYLGGRDI